MAAARGAGHGPRMGFRSRVNDPGDLTGGAPKGWRHQVGQFVNLHSHTSHSVRDGLAGIDELVDRAAELGQPAVAITDHGTLSGGWKLAQAAGIKPIVGAELYVSIGSRHERAVDAVPADLIGADGGPVRTAAAEAPAPGGYKASTFQHLTVLAQTSRGYRNLSTMS